MTNEQLHVDGSASMNIYLAAHHSWGIEIEAFDDEAETIPRPFTGNFKMTVSHDKAGCKPVMILAVGSGLTIEGNKITIDVQTLQNKLTSQMYYYDLRQDIGLKSAPWIEGTIYTKQKPGRK